MNLNKAYSTFYFGKPRFKSKKNCRASYSTNDQKALSEMAKSLLEMTASISAEVGW